MSPRITKPLLVTIADRVGKKEVDNCEYIKHTLFLYYYLLLLFFIWITVNILFSHHALELWLLVGGTVGLNPLRASYHFQPDTRGFLLSLLSHPETTYFVYWPLTLHIRGETHRNKQAKSADMEKHKNIQLQHHARDLLVLHLLETKWKRCSVRLVFRIVPLGLMSLCFWVHLDNNGAWLFNKYLLNTYCFQFSRSKTYWTFICAGWCAMPSVC